jgi:hypothetical protein
MLTLCKQHRISYGINPVQYSQIYGGKTTIRSIFGNISKPQIKSLRNQSIMFLEQLTSLDGKFLLPWKCIRERTFSINPCNRTPSWFNQLESIIIVDASSRMIQPDLAISATHMKGHKIPPIDMTNNDNIWTVI